MQTSARRGDFQSLGSRSSTPAEFGAGVSDQKARQREVGEEVFMSRFRRLSSSGFASPQPEQGGGAQGARAERPVSVLVADDHPIVREGLTALINRQSDMRVVAEASNGRDAVDLFLAELPDVALLDLRMPVMDGIETVTAIRQEVPSARLVIITTYQRGEDIYRALKAGVQGYLLKDAPVEELVRCIQAVSKGNTWIPPVVGAQLARRVTDRELTPREAEVLHTVVKGKSNKEIGVTLDISEATVKVHVTHILEKLHVTGRAEAINVAIRRGLVNLDSVSAA